MNTIILSFLVLLLGSSVAHGEQGDSSESAIGPESNYQDESSLDQPHRRPMDTTALVTPVTCDVRGSQDLMYTLPPQSICSFAQALYGCNASFTQCLSVAESSGTGCDQMIYHCLPEFLRCVNTDLLKRSSNTNLCPWAGKTHDALIAVIFDPKGPDLNFTGTGLGGSCRHVACSIRRVHNSSCFSEPAPASASNPCSVLQYRTLTHTTSWPLTQTQRITESTRRLTPSRTVVVEPTPPPTPASAYNYTIDLITLGTREATLATQVDNEVATLNPSIPVLPDCPVWFTALDSRKTTSEKIAALWPVALDPELSRSLVLGDRSSSFSEGVSSGNTVGEASSSFGQGSITGDPPSTPPAVGARVGYLPRDTLSSLVGTIFRDFLVNLGVMDDILYQLESSLGSTPGVNTEAEAALNRTERTMLAASLVKRAMSSNYAGCMVTPAPPTPESTPAPPTPSETNATTPAPTNATVAPQASTPTPPSTEPPVNDVTLAPTQRIGYRMKIKNLPDDPFNEETFKKEICTKAVYDCFTNELVIIYEEGVKEGSPVFLEVEFRGSRAEELQRRASGLASGSKSLLAIGVLSVQAAPVVPPTEAPSLLQRSSSLLWVAGAGCLGGGALIGAAIWWVRDKAARKRRFQANFNGYEETEVPMLQVPDQHSRV